MAQVLEKRKRPSLYPFSAFSLLFLLDFDSINELVGSDGARAGAPSTVSTLPPDLVALAALVSSFWSLLR